MKIIKFLRGKKRNIGIIALTLLNGVNIFWPGTLTPEKMQWANEMINIVLIVGRADSVRRTETGKKIIDKSLSKVKK